MLPSPTSPSLSPTEILTFLKNAKKDRLILLRLETELKEFINDSAQEKLEFPNLNSYQRLIVHRVAQYFRLAHKVDNKRTIMVAKLADTEIPALSIADLIPPDSAPIPDSTGFKIMRRSRPEGQEAAAAAAAERLKEQRSKQSIEEREAAYRLARARIFGDESSNVSEKSTKSKKHGRRRSGSNEGSGTGSAESLIDENQAMTGSTESLKKHWPKATPPVEDFETYNRNPSLGYGGFMNPMAMQYWGMPYIPMGTPSNVPLSSHPMPMMANGIPNNQQMLGGYNDSGNVYMSGISPMGPWNPNIGSNNGSNGPGWGAPWNGQGGWNYNQMDEISNRVKGDQSYRPSSAEHSSDSSKNNLKGCILEVYEMTVPSHLITIPGAYTKAAHGTMLAIFASPAHAKAHRDSPSAQTHSGWKVRDWFGNAG